MTINVDPQLDQFVGVYIYRLEVKDFYGLSSKSQDFEINIIPCDLTSYEIEEFVAVSYTILNPLISFTKNVFKTPTCNCT